MRYLGWSLVVAMAAVGGCASQPEREWMKINEPYTSADLRRDHAACTRDGKLDEACMRNRGWVGLSRRQEKPPDLSDRARQGGRY
jgi:hypothetical protein